MAALTSTTPGPLRPAVVRRPFLQIMDDHFPEAVCSLIDARKGVAIFPAELCSSSGWPTAQHLTLLLSAGNCNGDAACRDDFYSDPVAVGYYKDHVRRIVTRVNTFNGRAYRRGSQINPCFTGIISPLCSVDVACILFFARHPQTKKHSAALLHAQGGPDHLWLQSDE